MAESARRERHGETSPSPGAGLTEHDGQSTSVETLLELKDAIVDLAKKELNEIAQNMARAEEQRFTHWMTAMEAAFLAQRRVEEERWNRERRQMEEDVRAEMRKMLGAVQELMQAGLGAESQFGGQNSGLRTASQSETRGERAERRQPETRAQEHRSATVINEEDSDAMDITITGRQTQLDLSKHAVNVHDRIPLTAQPKNISKHAETQAPRAPAQKKKEDPPMEILKADPKPQAAPPKTNVRPVPGLGAVSRPAPRGRRGRDGLYTIGTCK
jgi:hypothetical protein